MPRAAAQTARNGHTLEKKRRSTTWRSTRFQLLPLKPRVVDQNIAVSVCSAYCRPHLSFHVPGPFSFVFLKHSLHIFLALVRFSSFRIVRFKMVYDPLGKPICDPSLVLAEVTTAFPLTQVPVVARGIKFSPCSFPCLEPRGLETVTTGQTLP